MKKDLEFSRPQGEFSLPPQEVFPPAVEFSLPTQEYHRTGTEFDQPPASVKKKKKSMNPLMLTATVVTTSIVLTAAPSSGQLSPKYPLDAEHCAYLDALDMALVQQDSNALLQLLMSPTLLSLEQDAVKPYYEMLLPTIDDWTYHHLYDADDSYIRMDFTYDGKNLGAEWDYRETEPSYGLSYITRSSAADGTPILSNAYFSKTTPLEDHDVTTKFHHYNFGISAISDTGTATHWYMEDYFVQNQKVPGGYDHGVPLEGRRISKNDQVLEVLEGTFALEPYEPEVGGMGYLYHAYLHNGTITVYLDAGGIWKTQHVVEVKDGHTIVKDGFMLKTPQETGYGHDTVYISLEDGTEYPLRYMDSDREGDPLYHTFRIS